MDRMRIELKNIGFSYAKRLPRVLDGANLTLEGGNIYVLTGGNGAGKTTLSKLICGLCRPQEGSVFIDGEDASRLRVAQIAAKIGYMFQNADLQIFAPTVLEDLTFPLQISKTLSAENRQRIENALELFGLADKKNQFPQLMSGGEKQRLALAGIAVRAVKFLILDEPSASIDGKGREFLAAYVNNFVQSGGGALIITHDPQLAQMLNSPTMLQVREGKIYEA